MATLNKEDFATKANARYEKAREFWRNWRSEARDSYAFIAGDQWLPDDKAILQDELRPEITFNYSEKMIDAVIGAEVSNRQEVRYSPRGMEDAPLAEVWNAAAQWVRDECNAEDEESDAFRDMLICGLGWTWTHMDYEQDPDGRISEDRVDPLEMYPDPSASKPGLIDRRWQDRLYWADEVAVRKHWPNAIFSEDTNNKAVGVVRTGHHYEQDADDDKDRHEGQVQLRIHECYELEPVYRVAQGNEVITLSEADFKLLNKQVEGGVPKNAFAKQWKRVYYRAYFAGDSLLEVKLSPCQDGFCFQAITGKRDRNKNTWYGLTRVMMDPQRWANKWLSQILHIINTNAKGGLMAEVGAFVDPVRAQEEWSKPDSITLFNEGALSQKKVQQKAAAPFPAGLDKLMEFALGSLPMVTGINLEALGLANREQAGVLEQQRKQAAYGLLAPMFDSLRRYRKEQGRILLYYIHNYISDGRMIRIGGPELQQFMPLTKAPDAPKYDIIVDQSPNAPDTKERTWQTLVEIMPTMMKEGIPLPPDVLDFTPLPTTLIMKWKQFIGQQQQIDKEAQEKMQELEQENMQLKNDQQVKMQELEYDREKGQADMQIQREKAEADIQLQRMKAQAEFELKEWEASREFELERRRMEHETSMQQEQMKLKKSQADNDFKLKAFNSNMTDGDMEKKVSFGIDTSAFGDIVSQLSQKQDASVQAIAQALQQLASSLSKPRKLLTDATGRPVGSVVADETETTLQ